MDWLRELAELLNPYRSFVIITGSISAFVALVRWATDRHSSRATRDLLNDVRHGLSSFSPVQMWVGDRQVERIRRLPADLWGRWPARGVVVVLILYGVILGAPALIPDSSDSQEAAVAASAPEDLPFVDSGETVEQGEAAVRQVTAADGSISAEVPLSWIEEMPVEVEGTDWVGFFVAPQLEGLGGYFEDFGTAPGMRLMWSAEKAQTHTTAEHIAGLSYYNGSVGEMQSFSDGRFVGHAQRIEIKGGAAYEYALKAEGDPDSPLIMLFVADSQDRIDDTVASIVASLEL